MKKHKKSFALFISVILTLQIMSINAFAANGTIVVNSVSFSKVIDNEETEIPSPENGFINTCVNVTYNGEQSEQSQDVILIAALTEKTTGKIIQISSATETLLNGQTKNLKSGINVTDISKYNFKYFIWDSLYNRIPLMNSAPSIPADFTASEIKTSSVKLSWSKSEDDKQQIGGYTLYRDGAQIATLTDCTYTDNYLNANTQYTYKLEAFDKEGLVSKAAVLETSTAIMANCVLTKVPTEEKLSFLLVDDMSIGDSYTIYSQKDGRDCRKSITYEFGGKVRRGMFYFRTDNAHITKDDSNITFEVTYFDEGTADIVIQYNAIDGNVAKSSQPIKRKNTNMWQTAVVSITDAKFVKAKAIQYCDFRITSSADLEIYKVAVGKTEEY